MGRTTKINKIVSAELWQKVSEENKELLTEFIEYCKSTNKSASTIKGYYNDVQIFYVWNVQFNKNKFFVELTKKDVIKYQNWMLNELGLGSSRVRRLRSALSSMSIYIESVLDDEYPDFRPIINKIPAPPQQEIREKTVLSDEQVDRLLDTLVASGKFQQACAVALAIASGARKSELLRFKPSYFVEENVIYGSLYKTPEKIRTKGRGNGKFLHKYILRNKFKPYFDLWMAEKERLEIVGDELFWGHRGGEYHPADISLLNSWSKTFSAMLGINWYWHCNRNYFTTAMCKANIPADVIKDIVGWNSTDMVSLYNSADVDEEIGKYFDEGGVKGGEVKSIKDL